MKDYIYSPPLTREQFQELADNAAFELTANMLWVAVFAGLALLALFARWQLIG